MESLTHLFVVAVVLAAALATISIWSPRRLWVKFGALALTIAFMPLAYASMADLLSKPKPVQLEWFRRHASEALVLSAQLSEGSGIYLWLQIGDSVEPRYYMLPWDQETAKALQEAMREAEKNQSGLVMEWPFERNWDKDQPKFYALPQPKLPDKDGEAGDAPRVYRHPGMNV